jgi:hypothetical protein
MPVLGGTTSRPSKGALAPLQELVALTVALELDLHVAAQGVWHPRHVGHHGVVDHELGGHERVDPPGVAAEGGHGVAHGGEVDDRRHAGEVLEEDPGRRERELLVARTGRVPRRQLGDRLLGHGDAVDPAQQVLQQDLEGVREAATSPASTASSRQMR